MKKTVFLLIIFLCALFLSAQESSTPPKSQGPEAGDDTNESTPGKKAKKKKINFFDTQDGYFDLSDFVINAHGFIPVPILITEPALGYFGGGLMPLFIKPNKARVKNGKSYYTPPDLTTVFGAGTLNGTWAVGASRMAHIEAIDARYYLGIAYASINREYYFDLEDVGETVSAEFNVKVLPLFLGLSKSVFDPRFTVGLEYAFSYNNIDAVNDSDDQYINGIEQEIADEIEGNTSLINFRINFDGRDSIFTPNSGVKASLKAGVNSEYIGSSYDYWLLEGEVMYYFQLAKVFTTGFNFGMNQVFGDIPFYVKPFVSMRGVPAGRYAGNTTIAFELEERWDFVPRFSLVAFGGIGTAFNEYSHFLDAELAWAAGLGFRYLLARQLKMRAGVDFAIGPEGFSYYIVFGSKW